MEFKNDLVNLYQGDCLDIMDKLIEDNVKVDITFTSPPYNRKRNDKYANYDDSIEDYYKFIVDFTNKALKITDKHVFVNIQTNYYNKEDVYRYIGYFSQKIQNIFIWEKTNPLPASGNNITNAFEYFFCLGNNPIKSNNTYVKNIIASTVNTTTTTKIHKAVMQLDVCNWFINNFTKSSDTIFDPFLGLGTTGISCINFNRKFIGVEINDKYCEIAKQRIEEVIKQEKLF